MSVNKTMTSKIKTYFWKNHLSRDTKFSNRQQTQLCKDIGCSQFQLVEFILFGVVSNVKKEEDK